MTNRDMLDEFAHVFRAIKDQYGVGVVSTCVPLLSMQSVVLNTWFCNYFRKRRHRLWLETTCHIQLECIQNGVRYLQITQASSVDLANVSLLTGLDDVYMHRSAFTAATASMVPAAQPSSPHGHANSAAIVSDSDCDSDLDYNPAAVEIRRELHR